MSKGVKLLILGLITLFSVITSILIIDYNNIKNEYSNEVVLNMKNEETQTSKFIYNIFSPLMGSIKNTASFISKVNISNEKEIQDVIYTMKKGIPLINSLYFIRQEDKKSIFYNKEFHNIDLSKNRNWILMLQQNKDTIITPVYENFITGKKNLSIVAPVYQNGQIKGVVGADIYLHNISQFVNISSLPYNGYQYIIDNEGNIIIHKDEKNLGTRLFDKIIIEDTRVPINKNKLKTNIFFEQEGTIRYINCKNKKMIAYYYKIPNLNWYVVNTAEKDSIEQAALRYIIKNIFIVVIVFTVSLCIYMIIGKEIYYKDRLTRLGNREKIKGVIKKRINKYKKNKKDIIFIAFKIKDFSNIRQIYGEETQKIVLRKIGYRLKTKFKNYGDIARINGDYFCIVLKSTEWDSSINKAKIMDKYFNSIILNVQGKNIEIEIMVLLTKWDNSTENEEEIIKILGGYLNIIKQTEGINLIIFKDMKELVSHKIKNERKKNNLLIWMMQDKIVPFFQPIYDIENNSVDKYEVLMRIEDGGQYLSPYKYINIAEKNNIIQKLDKIVIKKALEYKNKINKEGRKFNISINISPKGLNEMFLSEILNMVKKYNINPEEITFEITETADLNKIEGITDVLLKYKNYGFKLAIDDIGTGFSNMSYLKNIFLNYFKIDGIFIKDIDKNVKSYYISNAFQNLAKAFKIKSIGEYVENENVYKVVKSLGINYAQGFYIGKPKKTILSYEEEKELIKKITQKIAKS